MLTEEPINWSEYDLASAAVVLEMAESPARDLMVLTDEEITALDGTSRSQLAPLPWLSSQDAEKGHLASVALRGLMARGLVEGALSETGELMIRANQEITGIQALRRTAQAIMMVEVTNAASKSWIVGYRHGDNSALIELIDPSGMHMFQVAAFDAFVAQLVTIANPFGATAGSCRLMGFSEDELVQREDLFDGFEIVCSFQGVCQGSDASPRFVTYGGREKMCILTPSGDSRYSFAGATSGEVDALIRSAMGSRSGYPEG